jgi:hypothetical protein
LNNVDTSSSELLSEIFLCTPSIDNVLDLLQSELELRDSSGDIMSSSELSSEAAGSSAGVGTDAARRRTGRLARTILRVMGAIPMEKGAVVGGSAMARSFVLTQSNSDLVKSDGSGG